MKCQICGGKVKYLLEKNSYSVFKCCSCGLGFLSPIPTQEEIESFYATGNYYKSEKGYEDYSILEKGYKKNYKKFIKDTEKEFNFDIKGKNVLDVGCAFGFFLDVARELGALELWGNDLILDCEKVVLNKGHNFIKGFFECLEFPENHFDLVFMGDVFEHFFNPFKVVEKLHAILKSKGAVIITTINFNSFFGKFMGKRWRLLNPPEHIYYWTKKAIENLFSKNKFEGVCRKYTLYVPKAYLVERLKVQFGFNPPFLKFMPFDIVPIRSFDTMQCVFRKKG